MTYPDRICLINPNHFGRYRTGFGSLFAHDSRARQSEVLPRCMLHKKPTVSGRRQERSEWEGVREVVNGNSHRREVARPGVDARFMGA